MGVNILYYTRREVNIDFAKNSQVFGTTFNRTSASSSILRDTEVEAQKQKVVRQKKLA